MPNPLSRLWSRSARQADEEPLLPRRREPPARVQGDLAYIVGRLRSLPDDPRQVVRAFERNPYQNLDGPSREEIEARGTQVMNDAAASAGTTTAAQVMDLSRIPGASQVPGAVNAAHSADQARRLLRLAEEIPELHRCADLKPTIRNCAYTRGLRSGSQWTSLAASGALSAGAAAAIVATGGLVLVPAVLITAAAGAGSLGAGKVAQQGFRRVGDWLKEIDRRGMAEILVDCGLDEADEDEDARRYAHEALAILGFDLTAWQPLAPPDPDHPDPDEDAPYWAAVQSVERLL